MSILDLFGGNPPTYNAGDAQNMFLWQQNQARYNTSNPFGSVTWDPNSNTQNVSYSPQLQGIVNNMLGGDAAAQRAEQSVYDSFSNRYEPVFNRQSNSAQDRLINQGIPVGSEAYSRAMGDLNQNQNDARLNAMNQATLTGQQMQAQNQQQNLNMFNSFNPLNGYSAGAGTPNIDIYGNQYASQLNNYNSQSGFWNNLLGGATTLGAAALMSDARIKENLRPVGQLLNGLTVYAFNFPGDNKTQLGLVAQEVMQVIPEAVYETEEGLLMVDYNAATQFEMPQEEIQENTDVQELQ